MVASPADSEFTFRYLRDHANEFPLLFEIARAERFFVIQFKRTIVVLLRQTNELIQDLRDRYDAQLKREQERDEAQLKREQKRDEAQLKREQKRDEAQRLRDINVDNQLNRLYLVLSSLIVVAFAFLATSFKIME
jgi:hypothetical protein